MFRSRLFTKLSHLQREISANSTVCRGTLISRLRPRKITTK